VGHRASSTNVLKPGALGLEAMGIDASPRAIRLAERKAEERNLAPRFLVGNVLELENRPERYETVLDCGLFHVIDDHDRTSLVKSLRVAIVSGGRYFLLCFSDQQPGVWGPRRVSRAEIESSFADGRHIESIEPSRLEITLSPDGACAWFAAIRRSRTT